MCTTHFLISDFTAPRFVVSRHESHIQAYLVSRGNVKRKLVAVCTFGIFSLRAIRRGAQRALDGVALFLDKSRSLFVLDNGANEDLDRLASASVSSRYSIDQAVKRDFLSRHGADTSIANVRIKARCSGVSANVHPSASSNPGHTSERSSGQLQRVYIAVFREFSIT